MIHFLETSSTIHCTANKSPVVCKKLIINIGKFPTDLNDCFLAGVSVVIIDGGDHLDTARTGDGV